MLKQTIQLFIKATIIGILINAGLAQLPSPPAPVEDKPTAQQEISPSVQSLVDGRTANNELHLD